MSISINGTNGLTFNDGSSQQTAASGFGFKNRIINGAMMIDQRNAGASVSNPSNYLVDRWKFANSQSSKVTFQQNAGSVTPPVGFTNYAGFTSSSAYSVVAGDYFAFIQPIEGNNCADLAWGTANAATVTLSFWVRSSLTGTFGCVLQNSNSTRSYPISYTISSANTWEQKTITIAGDTTGTWLTTNGTGIQVFFSLGAGSTFSGASGSWAGANYYGVTGQTSVVGTNGATFYITGVQLEKGSTATSFDYRPYGTELALCQRYYIEYPASSVFTGFQNGTTAVNAGIQTPVTLRGTPAISIAAGTSYCIRQTTAASSTSTTISSISFSGANQVGFSLAGFTGLTDLYVAQLYIGGKLTISSEL